MYISRTPRVLLIIIMAIWPLCFVFVVTLECHKPQTNFGSPFGSPVNQISFIGVSLTTQHSANLAIIDNYGSFPQLT